MNDPTREVYLGDGLYVSFDGEMVKLRAPKNFNKNDLVYLDRDVFIALLMYVNSVAKWKVGK